MKRAFCIFLFALVGIVPLKPALAQVAISVSFGPPALPVYEQPQCPEDGNLWVPGYWAWDADYEDYFWVPGTWVAAPEPGYLWTPAWWGWDNGAYSFHDGYWATEVGFYGGINYGYGYYGNGFGGGRWQDNHFYYNTAVMNVNTTIVRNVYVNKTVIVNNNVHVSYNGGQGGIQARPTQQEEAVARMRHVPAPAAQQQRIQLARSNPQMRASANQGRPPVAATQRPTQFSGSGVVQAKAAGAPYHPPANKPAAHGQPARPANQQAHPAAQAPARPETRQPTERPAPESRPAPAPRAQPEEQPKARPETAPRPPARTEPQPEAPRPAPQSRPAPAPKQERPAPKAQPPARPEERPAPKPKPESKPKPEEKKKEPQ